MGKKPPEKPSTMLLGEETREHIGRIMQKSASVGTMVGVIRGLARRWCNLLQLQEDAEGRGGRLEIVEVDSKGHMRTLERLDCKLL